MYSAGDRSILESTSVNPACQSDCMWTRRVSHFVLDMHAAEDIFNPTRETMLRLEAEYLAAELSVWVLGNKMSITLD